MQVLAQPHQPPFNGIVWKLGSMVDERTPRIFQGELSKQKFVLSISNEFTNRGSAKTEYLVTRSHRTLITRGQKNASGGLSGLQSAYYGHP